MNREIARPSRRWPLTAVALVVAATVGWFAYDTVGGKPAAASGAAAAPAPAITAAVVLERAVAERQQFSGRLEAIEQIDIRSRVGGFVTAVNFKPGSLVRKGDVLFVIDPRPFQAELARAEASASAARAKAALAKLELRRAELLLADKAIAQQELDVKASSLKQLDADVQAAQATLEVARVNLGYTRVSAPIDGRVSKAEVSAGNLVDSAVVLTSVVSNGAIHASFEGDEESFLRVSQLARQGAPVAVNVGLANEQGFPHRGKLDFVDNRLNSGTGSVRMRAVLENADGLLAPGLFARIELGGNDSAPPRVALINERAVGTDQNRKYVYVVTADGKAEYRQVTLGPLVDGMRIVRSGVKAGEKIVVSGLQRVQPGVLLGATMVPMDGDQQALALGSVPKVASVTDADAMKGGIKQ